MTQAPTTESAHRVSEDSYRKRLEWDSVSWGTHCVDCFPGGCPYRVYVKDGKVRREEVAGTIPVLFDDIPDRNPMGCNKGAGWSKTLDGGDRVLYPLKRAGERGEGKWERLSWDQALTEIADALLDAIEEGGPESIIRESTPGEGGATVGFAASRLISQLLGGLSTDVNGVINDFQQGQYITWGKFNPSISPESRYRTELNLIWHSNPMYTGVPYFHFATESRYEGAEEILIGPDVSPSHVHVDSFIPVKIASDGAFALGMCQVLIEEDRLDLAFIKDQTDLPLLVRRDTRRFLRASDLDADVQDDDTYFGGHFFMLDWHTGEVVPAPRETLALGEIAPQLRGEANVTLVDGSTVEVVPAFQILREKLDAEYTPEKASEICGVHPDEIRKLARKVATKRTSISRGMNLCKYYHGDLMERSMLLLLALTGNWGKVGCGMGSWSPGGFQGPQIFSAKRRRGIEEAYRVIAASGDRLAPIMEADPSLTREMAAIQFTIEAMRQGSSRTVPITYLYYWHYGYRENWNNPEWGDPAMVRTFDEYFDEAMEKGWWQGVTRPDPETTPLVLIEIGGNMLRRARGGRTMLFKELWPKLKTIISVDWRMTTTGMYSDYVLPAAQHYEKMTFHFAEPILHKLTFADRAVDPAGESMPEWEMFGLLAEKLEERAKARDITTYVDAAGREINLEDLHYRYTLDIEKEDELVEEWMRDTALTDTLEEGASLQKLRDDGFVSIEKMGEGAGPYVLNQASDVEEDRPFVSLRWHTENKIPYPTLTRRAQFYIDHEWFLEGGEELPVHKDNPKMGGDYPFEMTSGHNRWSIHSMNITNELMLETHRGRPHMVINDEDAERKGLRDDDEVHVFNDVGSFNVPVKIGPWVRPGQVIVYNGWDPYQFRGWTGPMDTEPGMVKWLHLAGGYGHLHYWPIQWQPTFFDRAIRVEYEKMEEA